MDEFTLVREARRFRKLRTLGTADYFCRACGQCDWRFRYERHHVAGRKHSSQMIWLCINCHDWITDMQKDEFNLSPALDADVREIVMLLKGHAELHERSAETLRRASRMVLGLVASNDNGSGEDA